MERGRGTYTSVLAAVLAVPLVLLQCSAPSKVEQLSRGSVGATLRLPKEEDWKPDTVVRQARRDTLKVEDLEGNEVFIMKAIRDDDGEMVANETLDAAVVTARFRNVAERHGRIDLEFQVVVPEMMQDSKWQLRFYPDMYVMEDSLRLDPVVITGRDYRRAQLKGYQQYEKFLSTIVSDTTKFIDLRQLEVFIRRNIPELYAFKTDSTEVSDERFEAAFGVTEREAIDHFTNKFARRLNTRRKSRMGKMYRKYVKVPIVTEGLRLDTVIQAVNGDFIYNYVQTITTRPKLRKVDIVLSGDIWESDKRVYTVPRSEPLTFYISSLSAFVDPAERYLTKVLERRVEANSACYVEFAVGKADVSLELGHNSTEIGRIRDNLSQLLRNETFDLDSIVVTASCSPEGSWAANGALSQRRSESVSRYFREWMRHYADSLDAERGVMLTVGDDGSETLSRAAGPALQPISFIPHCDPENWKRLDVLVEADTLLTEEDKASYRTIREERDPDRREKRLSAEPRYRYLREQVYPYLRTVRFDFHLHRKGMVKDTVHTTELDTLYMRGVQALRDRDYETALTILRPYNDYNTAVAYCSLDYNASALAILETLPRDARVNYMLALVHSRRGDDQKAVQCYLHAVAQEPQYKFRGNLDPEIAALIKRYDLNKSEENEDIYSF